ncbi:MAG: HAMP domain-containing histidine kinase [Melioribacteraceae bacterium]|nr:HAMP domain-containing histidine kinase [Melioribacteraceae bacterium]
MGLGLTVAEKFIEFNTGKLQLESEPGKGTTVTILFPCVDNAGNIVKLQI